MPDILNFTLLDTGYFYIPINVTAVQLVWGCPCFKFIPCLVADPYPLLAELTYFPWYFKDHYFEEWRTRLSRRYGQTTFKNSCQGCQQVCSGLCQHTTSFLGTCFSCTCPPISHSFPFNSHWLNMDRNTVFGMLYHPFPMLLAPWIKQTFHFHHHLSLKYDFQVVRHPNQSSELTRCPVT